MIKDIVCFAMVLPFGGSSISIADAMYNSRNSCNSPKTLLPPKAIIRLHTANTAYVKKTHNGFSNMGLAVCLMQF